MDVQAWCPKLGERVLELLSKRFRLKSGNRLPMGWKLGRGSFWAKRNSIGLIRRIGRITSGLDTVWRIGFFIASGGPAEEASPKGPRQAPPRERAPEQPCPCLKCWRTFELRVAPTGGRAAQGMAWTHCAGWTEQARSGRIARSGGAGEGRLMVDCWWLIKCATARWDASDGWDG